MQQKGDTCIAVRSYLNIRDLIKSLQKIVSGKARDHSKRKAILRDIFKRNEGGWYPWEYEKTLKFSKVPFQYL